MNLHDAIWKQLDPTVDAVMDRHEDVCTKLQAITYHLNLKMVEECDIQRALNSLEIASQAMLDVSSASSSTLFSTQMFELLALLTNYVHDYGEFHQAMDVDFDDEQNISDFV